MRWLNQNKHIGCFVRYCQIHLQKVCTSLHSYPMYERACCKPSLTNRMCYTTLLAAFFFFTNLITEMVSQCHFNCIFIIMSEDEYFSNVSFCVCELFFLSLQWLRVLYRLGFSALYLWYVCCKYSLPLHLFFAFACGVLYHVNVVF